MPYTEHCFLLLLLLTRFTSSEPQTRRYLARACGVATLLMGGWRTRRPVIIAPVLYFDLVQIASGRLRVFRQVHIHKRPRERNQQTCVQQKLYVYICIVNEMSFARSDAFILSGGTRGQKGHCQAARVKNRWRSAGTWLASGI